MRKHVSLYTLEVGTSPEYPSVVDSIQFCKIWSRFTYYTDEYKLKYKTQGIQRCRKYNQVKTT